jgi:UDP-N-acetylmuramoylalanine--D-glutamate ligase
VDDGNLVLRLEDHIQVICRVEDLALRGPHNVLNVLAACALGSIVQIGVDAMATVAKTFRGVPHRLEFIRQVLGAAWYNDSIATTPDRALAAVRSFEEPLVVMVGGRDKELTWDVYVAEVAKRAKAVVLFGEARHMLQDVFQTRFKREDAPELYLVKNFEQAFQKATEVVQPGDVVLLSPGCTSYDEFQNFEARGERYKEMVSTL